MDKRLLQRTRVKLGHTPASTSGTTPVSSAVIDRLGEDGSMAESAILVVENAVHTGGTVVLTPTVVEGDTSSPADAVTLKAAMSTIDCAAAKATAYEINLSGFKRYVKFILTPAITTSGVVLVGSAVVLGDLNLVKGDAAPAVIAKA